MSVLGVNGFQGYRMLKKGYFKEGAYKLDIKMALKTGISRFVKVLNRG
jgi:hypothetical protein